MAAPQYTPQNLAEVEALVVELYEPGNPTRISQIQQSLHAVQRSHEGWQLANTLLRSSNEKVQFFGALTFTVKLNTDSASLNPEDAKHVLNQVLSWLVTSIQRASPPLVIRKLCNTLVVYFLNFASTWTLCVKHLLVCLYANEVVDIALLQDAPDIAQLYSRLSPEKVSAALWFATTLAEDVGKTDGNNIKHHKFHDMLRKNVQDVVDLIRPGIQNQGNGANLPTVLRQDSMKCFQAWLLYSHRVLLDTRMPLDPLKTLTHQAITCLVDEDLYEVTADLLTDTLTNYSSFFAEADFALLFSLFTSDWSKSKYTQLIQGDFGFDSLQYGQLLLAFGDARIGQLVKSKDDASRQFLSALEGFLAAEGSVVAEDQIFIPALEFWSTFVEYLTDSLYSDDDSASLPDVLAGEEAKENQSVVESEWFVAARGAVLRAIEHCWRKIQYPPEEDWRSWDSTERAGFKDARMEVIDLLQASFTLTGVPLFSMFADMTLQSLGTETWDELEASLFCLSGLVDFVPDDDSADDVLQKVISSNLFTKLSDASSGATPRVRQTALSLIGKYDEFFKKHAEYLPQALTFLFQAVTTPQLAPAASKSIYSLCFSCRQSLVGELGVFTQQYHELSKIANGDNIVNERLAGAIAAIIQAIPNEESKHAPLMSLLQSVGIGFQRCMELLGQGNATDAEVKGIDVLRCIQGIAKGLQVPADIPVELSDNEFETSNQYWLSGPGRDVQQQVQTLIQTCITSFPQSSELIDTACGIYRAGFIERVPGPFVFSSEAVVNFVTGFPPQNGRIVAIINTACCFVSAQGAKRDTSTNAALSGLCTWVLGVMQAMQEPSADPDTAQTVIDFLHRLLSRNAGLVFGQPANVLEHILMFVLSAFRGRDPLPKTSAADFLSTLLSLSELEPAVQTAVDAALAQLGQLIADAIVFNISGNAARSEIDKVCDPLRKLVIRHPGAKVWLQNAMFGGNFSSDRIKDADKTMFLQKILNLRGGRETNRVVKNFWLDCRGSNFAYTS